MWELTRFILALIALQIITLLLDIRLHRYLNHQQPVLYFFWSLIGSNKPPFFLTG